LDNAPEQQGAADAASVAVGPPSILLGSLCPVGQYHYSKKQRWIGSRDCGPAGNKTNKSKMGCKSEQQQQMMACIDGNHDGHDNDPCRRNKEQKQQRRRQRNQQRVSMRERLGDHCAINADHGVGKRKRVSKILQTTTASSSSSLILSTSTMERANNNSNIRQPHQHQQQPLVDSPPSSEHWMDFDLGYCMLELVVDPSTGKRALFAFESLEIMALDEDDYSNDDDYDQEECDTA
jgi:hypothetical protein